MRMFTNECCRYLNTWRTEFANSFKIFLMLGLLSSFFTTGIFGQVGTAPVSPPVGGLQIDGYLDRHTTDHGDWLNGTGIYFDPTGTRYLFNCNGTSPYPSLLGQSLFWKKDPYTVGGTTFGGTEDRFTGGSQLNDNPGTWKWDTHAPQSKDDINNAWFYIALDTINHTGLYPGNHWWAMMAGDREVTNGTSYLDFEFLQAPVNKVAGGTFTTAGTDGGRTVGDIDVTLSYTGGGGVAKATVYQWDDPNGDGTFEYILLATLPVGSVFVQSNKTEPTPIPCTNGALFGLNEYTDSLQFVEGAIDITQLLGNGIGTLCRALPFTTIFIKTKSSAATTAELKDFIAPFAIDICSDHTAPAFTGSYANVPLGCNPAASDITAALNGATASDNCGTPTITQSDGAQTGTCTRSQTRTFTATDDCGNAATVSRTVTWTADNTSPTFTGSYTTVVLGCSNPESAAITAALDGATATDACGTPTVSSTDGSDQGSGCSRSRTRTFTATDGCGNTATASRTVTWTQDNTSPTFTGSYTTMPLGCNPDATAITAALNGATATDNCGSPTITQSDNTASGTCTRSQTRTFTATDGCGNTATASRTVTWTQDNTPPVFTSCAADVVIECTAPTSSANTGSPVATDICSTVTFTFADVSSTIGCNTLITRTWTARDVCGNTATCVQRIIKVDRTPPVFTSCPANTGLGTPTATDACSPPVTLLSQDIGTTRKWIAIDANGNTSTCSQTIVGGLNRVASPITEESKTVVSEDQKTTTTNSPTAIVPVKDLKVQAYPNPYTDQVNFRFISPQSGAAKLELYDMVGKQLAVIHIGNVKAGIEKSINYKIPALRRISMIYKLTMGNQSGNGTLISGYKKP